MTWYLCKSFAVAGGLLAAGPAFAATVEKKTGALPLPPGHEAVAVVGNTCAGEASYLVTFRQARTGETLKRQRGTIAAGRAAVVVMAADGIVLVNTTICDVRVTCDGSVGPQPLVSVYLRDAETLAPRLAGEVQEGTGI